MSKYSIFGVNIQPEIISEENNILRVSSKKEIYFDIFECSFNGKKIIVEKIDDINNQPLVEFKLNKGDKVLKCQALLKIDRQNNLLLKESKSAKKLRIITEEKKAIDKEEKLKKQLIIEEKKAIVKRKKIEQESIIEEERLRVESITNEVIETLNEKVRLDEAKKLEESKQAIKLEQERLQKEKIDAEIKLIEEQQEKIKEEEWIEQSKIKLIEEVKRKEIKRKEKAKRLEEERLIEEAKRLEEERLIEEAKRLEEERIKQEKIKLIEEAERLEEERLINETKKLEEEIHKEYKSKLKFYNSEHSYKIDVDYNHNSIKIINETTGVDKIFETKGAPRKVILNQNTLIYDNIIDESSHFNYTIDIESQNVINKKLIDSSIMGGSDNKKPNIESDVSVAYSLRDLFGTGQNVIEVQSSTGFQSSSPENTRSFTAEEITNGTLVSFCNDKGFDGYIKKLYDQKNENNAEVSGGASISMSSRIVKDGALITSPVNGLPAIEVSNDDLSYLKWSNDAIAADGQYSVFNVMQNNSGTNITESTYLRIRCIKDTSAVVMNQIRIGESNNTLEFSIDDISDFHSTEQNSIVISSHIFNDDQFDENNNGTAKLYINGVLEDTRGYERLLNQDFDDEGSNILGQAHSSLNSVYFQEFLFYPLDKTDSREEIESSLSIYSA